MEFSKLVLHRQSTRNFNPNKEIEEDKINIVISLEKIDEYNLAQLLYMLEVQTAIAGELYNINTFDQPGVEQAKNYTYALMGRAGYEGSAETLREKISLC